MSSTTTPSSLLALHPHTVVVVFIDVVDDFMTPDGAFAKFFGEADTEPMRAILPEVDALAVAATQAGTPTVFVTSE